MTLKRLFSLPKWGAHLTFKGGTSLSKAWNLVSRLSEDLDLVLERKVLGFGGAKDPSRAPTRKKQEKLLDSLGAACSERIRDGVKPELAKALAHVLPPGEPWSLDMADDDPDEQTLVFRYPAGVDVGKYVRPDGDRAVSPMA